MTEDVRTNGRRPSRAAFRSIALPVEHGGWGFTLEPILLGLLVAPSAAAWELSVAALAGFLARRPLRLVLTDLTRRRWLGRTTVAAVFAAGYGVIALAGVVGALATVGSRFLIAYAVAVPPALLAIYADSRSKSRTLFAELSGAAAMGSTVTAIALADGWALPEAFGLWLVLIARAVTTIGLVRAQIRRVHGRAARERGVYAALGVSLAVMAVSAVAGVVPWLAVLAIGGIGVLSYVSLTRPPTPARVVGWTQIVTGLVVVLLTAAGVR
jgi:hypothetical protein